MMEGNPVYLPEHKSVLQYLMMHKMTPYNRLEEILFNASDGKNRDLEKAIEEINKSIQCFFQKVMVVDCEVTGQKMVVIVSTASREDLKSYLSPTQIEYFYQLLHAMVSTNGFIPSMQALNLAQRVSGGRMNDSEAERCLDLFVEKKLLLNDSGFFCLSPLSLAQIGPFLSERYQLEPCVLCRKLLVVGVRCTKCEAPIHRHCLERYKSSFKKQARCPACKNMWIEPMQQSPQALVPEDPATSDSDD